MTYECSGQYVSLGPADDIWVQADDIANRDGKAQESSTIKYQYEVTQGFWTTTSVYKHKTSMPE